jgi:hypothetical protein
VLRIKKGRRAGFNNSFSSPRLPYCDYPLLGLLALYGEIAQIATYYLYHKTIPPVNTNFFFFNITASKTNSPAALSPHLPTGLFQDFH